VGALFTRAASQAPVLAIRPVPSTLLEVFRLGLAKSLQKAVSNLSALLTTLEPPLYSIFFCT
jgi:hypothetical protein